MLVNNRSAQAYERRRCHTYRTVPALLLHSSIGVRNSPSITLLRLQPVEATQVKRKQTCLRNTKNLRGGCQHVKNAPESQALPPLGLQGRSCDEGNRQQPTTPAISTLKLLPSCKAGRASPVIACRPTDIKRRMLTWKTSTIPRG